MLTFRQFSEATFSVGIDYSLEAKYQHFNILLFGGELPTIPITWSSAMKKASGRVWFTPMNFGFSVKPGSLRMEISSLFRSSEERLDGVLVHEMIHVYFLGVKDDGRESHGSGFRAKLAELQQKVSFSIPVSDDITDLELSDDVRQSDVGVVLWRRTNGENYASFFGKALWTKYNKRLIDQCQKRTDGQYSFYFGKTNLHRKYRANDSSSIRYNEVTGTELHSIEAMPIFHPAL